MQAGFGLSRPCSQRNMATIKGSVPTFQVPSGHGCFKFFYLKRDLNQSSANPRTEMKTQGCQKILLDFLSTPHKVRPLLRAVTSKNNIVCLRMCMKHRFSWCLVAEEAGKPYGLHSFLRDYVDIRDVKRWKLLRLLFTSACTYICDNLTSLYGRTYLHVVFF